MLRLLLQAHTEMFSGEQADPLQKKISLSNSLSLIRSPNYFFFSLFLRADALPWRREYPNSFSFNYCSFDGNITSDNSFT